jgi:arsenite/tail-anchored protein-transporting ATPase
MTVIKPKHVVMFAGKGGVGKTTTAGAAALHFASAGEPTLIISTDPTPSLSHIYEIKDKHKPVKVLDNLFLAEVGLDEVRQMWDRKFGREVYEVFSSFVAVEYPEFVEFMSSILPGLAEEFMVDYIRELAFENTYEHIVWDTAPLGQTLGLLETPAMLREHLRPAPRIYSRLKLGAETRRPIMEILKSWEQLSAGDMKFLRETVRFVLVTIPEALAFEQLDGILAEMCKYGFRVEMLVVNNVVKDIGCSAFLQARAAQQQHYLSLIYSKYSHLQIVEIPMFPHEIIGADRLHLVEKHLFPRNGLSNP